MAGAEGRGDICENKKQGEGGRERGRMVLRNAFILLFILYFMLSGK
jgi:hypothetical protein